MCLCVCTIALKVFDIGFSTVVPLYLSKASSKVKVTGQSAMSQNENIPSSAVDARYEVFLDFDRVLCAKCVGATSSKSFLVKRETDKLVFKSDVQRTDSGVYISEEICTFPPLSEILNSLC